MNKKVFFVIMLLLASTQVGCNRIPHAEDNTIVPYGIKDVKYIIDDDVNNVQIIYPQIFGLHDEEIQNTANSLLRETALTEIDDYALEKGLGNDVDYRIQYQDNHYLSISFDGYAMIKGAPYPRDMFATMTIDITTGNRVRLQDIVTIDKEFLAVFRATLEQYAEERPDWAILYEMKLTNSDDFFINVLSKADNIISQDYFSYITNEHLVIRFQESRMSLEIEIKYEDIQNSLLLQLP